jgi:hypothetical protein
MESKKDLASSKMKRRVGFSDKALIIDSAENSEGARRSTSIDSIKSSTRDMAVDLWEDDFPIKTIQRLGDWFHAPISTYTFRDSDAEIASNAPHIKNTSGQSVNSLAYSKYFSVNLSAINDPQENRPRQHRAVTLAGDAPADEEMGCFDFAKIT